MKKRKDPEELKKVEPAKEPTEKFVTKSDFEKFMERVDSSISEVVKSVSNLSRPKNFVADDSKLGKIDPIKSEELSIGHGDIERVSEHDFAKSAELEEFMNQELVIIVHSGHSKDENPVVVPMVNSKTMPIIRNVKTKVKRKYVEALARCTHTRYDQSIPDSAHPDKFLMVAKTTIVDRFTVVNDPYKYGKEWLESILAEAA